MNTVGLAFSRMERLFAPDAPAGMSLELADVDVMVDWS